MPSALVIFAHPRDVEFLAAGTLVLLRQAGWDIHCMTLSSGDCGSRLFDPQQTSEIRVKEAMTAAQLLGARYHGAPGKDFQLVYEVEPVRRLAAVIRKVAPAILLTHSPENCLEDHTNTARLVVSAALVRAVPNFGTHPPSEAVEFDTTIYHAMPCGLRDGMRRKVFAEVYIDTTSVHDAKRAALRAHASQADWEQARGLGDGLETLERMAREVGRMSGRFELAEGWRRHHHAGLSREEIDPLTGALPGKHFVNPAYREALDHGSYPDR